MIRFVDLENHNVFNGSKPYVFWMDREQSVNLIYIKRICVLSDQEALRVYLPHNDVFQFINMQNVDQYADVNVNDFDYKDLSKLYTFDYESIGVPYDNYFLHMIYIAGQSTAIGEFHENFTLGNESDGYEQFEIGSDFYAEDEELKINLANFGVEIPESIQNAIYDVNIHEEANDNITLNRKYKELLLQYWDIVANRGSYKSLLNSLSWFEYGNIVQLNEIWKHSELNRTTFSRGELNTELTKTIKSTLSDFAKTTYIGLYAAMEKFVTDEEEVQHDHHMSNKGFLGEETPLLEALAMKWTREEMSLKMYLLGCFYEAYFMPIHLDLLHSTIEDVVFTNTIKVLSADNLNRFDYVSNFDSFDCNVKDEDVFQLGDVHVQAGDMLKKHYNIDEPDSQITETELYSDEYTCADDWSSGVVLIDKTALSNVVTEDKLNVYVTAISSGTEWPQVYIQYINSSHSWVDFTDTHNFVLTGQTPPCTASIILTRAMLDDISNGLQLVVKGAGYTANRITIMHEPFVDKTPMSNSIESLDEIGDYDDYPVFGVEDEYNKQMALQDEDESTAIVNDRLKTFMINYYDGVGVLVPIHCTMNGDENDFINKEVIRVITYVEDEQGKKITNEKTLIKHEMYRCIDGKIEVDFRLLLTEEGDTVLNFGFYTAGGRTYVRSIHIRVLGDTLCKIHLYRVKANSKLELTDDFFNKNVIDGTNEYRDYLIRAFNDYMFSHVRSDERLRDYEDYVDERGYTDQVKKQKFMELAGFHRLFVPGVRYVVDDSSDDSVNESFDKKGIQLNYVCIINKAGLEWLAENETYNYDYLTTGSFDKEDPDYPLRNFDLAVRDVHADPNDESSEIVDTYYTFISRDFDDLYRDGSYKYDDIKTSVQRAAQVGVNNPSTHIVVIRNDDGFFPQKHYLEELGVRLKYEPNDEGEIVFAGISHGQSLEDYTVEDCDTVVVIPEAKYNKLTVKDVEWIFINKSQVGAEREIKMVSTKEPFINKDIKKRLDPGFYDVIFRYKVGSTPHEVRLNSAFRKVDSTRGAFI